MSAAMARSAPSDEAEAGPAPSAPGGADRARTDKAPSAFRTISEVAEELDLPQHVLRFWETRFAQIKPLKRGGDRRYYRPDDIELLRGIRHLLYGQGYTIKGVQKLLREQGLRSVQRIGAGEATPSPPEPDGEPDAEPAELASQEPSEGRPGLAPGDVERLRQVLGDLVECRRLLAALRDPLDAAGLDP